MQGPLKEMVTVAINLPKIPWGIAGFNFVSRASAMPTPAVLSMNHRGLSVTTTLPYVRHNTAERRLIVI